MNKVILIAGPTASGKSSLALRLAEKFGGVIINADSMQVYRELHILSARPSAADEARAPHRLYGHVSACTAYSTGAWLRDVAPVIADVQRQNRLPIIVGGTGLYFKALLEGFSEIPDIPQEIRDYWRSFGKEVSAKALHEALQERDEIMAARLSSGDTQRIIRALEVVETTGKSLSWWQERPQKSLLEEYREKTVKIVIAPEREIVYERINRRLEQMVGLGGLEEVQKLQDLSPDPSLPAMRALGVPQFMASLRGELALEKAVEEAQMLTRRYAKRQFTWLRSNMISWGWHDLKLYESQIDEIFALID